jgi:hypothetical protein
MILLPRDVTTKRPKLPKATRMPLKVPAAGKRMKSKLDGIEDASQRARLMNAIRMDNRGPWFLCRSHWTVEQLERRFAEELVGTVLYHRIGGMLQGDKPYIYLQIALMKSVIQQLHPDSEPEWVEEPVEGDMPEHDVVTALRELQTTVIDRVPDIRDVIASGRY